jgi:hypothetical protein
MVVCHSWFIIIIICQLTQSSHSINAIGHSWFQCCMWQEHGLCKTPLALNAGGCWSNQGLGGCVFAGLRHLRAWLMCSAWHAASHLMQQQKAVRSGKILQSMQHVEAQAVASGASSRQLKVGNAGTSHAMMG